RKLADTPRETIPRTRPMPKSAGTPGVEMTLALPPSAAENPKCEGGAAGSMTCNAPALIYTVPGNDNPFDPFNQGGRTMMNRNRREFLADVGKGMLLASVGSTLAFDLGLTPAFAVEGKDTLSF